MKLQKKEFDKEGQLTRKLVAFLQEEAFYTVRRLLAADVKELYIGPRSSNTEYCSIPELKEAKPHPTKGGLHVTEYLTYNCLQDETDTTQTYMQFQWHCPFCEQSMMVNVLERMHHQAACRETVEMNANQESRAGCSRTHRNQQEYFCEDCQKTLYLSNTDILKHNRSHRKRKVDDKP